MSRFFPYKKPPISQGLIYLIALAFAMTVVIQSSKTVDEDIVLNFNHILLFTINYLLWAAIIPWLYGALSLFFDRGSIYLDLLIFTTRVFIIIIAHFILSNILYYALLMLISDYTWSKFLSDMKMVYLRAIASRFIDTLVIVSLLKITENYQSLVTSRLQLSELEKQLSQSKLTALKAQLNPHFLFNSLHALHALIGYDDKKAKSMTIKISNLLRKSLDQSSKHFISLDEELAYLKDYMDIELERFHDRLTINISVKGFANEKLVPNMILQPLVENAFKHGISLLEGEGYIKLGACVSDEGQLEITISNTIPTDNKEQSNVPSIGIGLANVQNRLKQVYTDDFGFEINKAQDEFTVQLTIPNQHQS